MNVFDILREKLHKEDLEFMQQSDLMACIDSVINQAEKEYNNGWISCSKRMPKERESIFAKFKGTEKWNYAMFEKVSDDVNVMVEFEDGTRKTMTLHTIDGKWRTDIIITKYKVIAWQPLPEPYREEVTI